MKGGGWMGEDGGWRVEGGDSGTASTDETGGAFRGERSPAGDERSADRLGAGANAVEGKTKGVEIIPNTVETDATAVEGRV
jgi:hypothetical protein